jgi:hypothetical protein
MPEGKPAASATLQLNARVPKDLRDNLAVVANLTGETVAEIVVDALQGAVDERLARPEVRGALQELMDRAKSLPR